MAADAVTNVAKVAVPPGAMVTEEEDEGVLRH
jgi:hypothetical protein